MTNETEVLVVGGGLVGLATGAFLAQQGVRVLVAERHATTSRHPKARLVNVRSMELYRALGVADAVYAAGEPNNGFALADTLAGEHQLWVPPPPDQSSAGGDLSPERTYSCDQQRLEPILLDRALALGARVRFGTEVSGLTQHTDGVTARLADADGTTQLRARYVIAADGARGGTRQRLGIGRHGQPVDTTAVSALFRADLEPALRGRRVDALLARAAAAYLFARGNHEDRCWQLGTYLRPDWDLDHLDGRVVEVIRAATGLPDLDPEIQDVRTWTTGAYVADRWRAGNVFLAGDAAHEMPPYGGFGGNTGVQDAHNLAWKLAAACRGDGGEALLDSYHTERVPVTELIVAQAVLRAGKTPGQPDPPGQIDALTLALGFRYPAAGASGYDPDRPVEDPARPSGQPGTRAAHVRLRDGRGSLDLLDPTRHTLIGPASAHPLADPPFAGVTVRAVDPAEVEPRHRNRWAQAYAGPNGTEAVLVRPDGVIAGRLGPTGRPGAPPPR